MLQTVGADPATEFLGRDRDLALPPAAPSPSLRSYRGALTDPHVVAALLADLALAEPIGDVPGAANAIAAAVGAERGPAADSATDIVELLPALFYRNKAAYAVGRFSLGGAWSPLVLALAHDAGGVRVDAVLTTADEASAVFGFTRSYFHVDVTHPRGTIEFLRSLLPAKRLDELYTAIGFNKHGKAVLFHLVLASLRNGDACFEMAEGEPGLVMCVFTLPSINVVFKVIKDRFGPSKRTTPEAVREKYQLVFVHDRVGRLADAQEFAHLEFERRWFGPDVLRDLLEHAGKTVTVTEDRVILRHAYTERRVVPLNLYLQRADPAAGQEAFLDYGQAIRDLAAANIFTGDMLLKNFGVTRHGRVICYDYDELCLLTECRFRRLPASVDPWDELRAEPWFHVAEEDVFPEEFGAFMVPRGELREPFLAVHADLLAVDYWLEMQRRQRAGEIVEFYPYRESRRLGR